MAGGLEGGEPLVLPGGRVGEGVLHALADRVGDGGERVVAAKGLAQARQGRLRWRGLYVHGTGERAREEREGAADRQTDSG